MSSQNEEEGSEVKTVKDILLSPRESELKFGLLIGLLKVNQVSNKDVVDTVLYLVRVFKLS